MADHSILDNAICAFLLRSNGQATMSDELIDLAGGRWRTVDARMQAMRRSGRIRWHGRSPQNHPPGVRSHGWEVLAEPAAQPETVQTVQEEHHG
jgi:hypothetical protein